MTPGVDISLQGHLRSRKAPRIFSNCAIVPELKLKTVHELKHCKRDRFLAKYDVRQSPFADWGRE